MTKHLLPTNDLLFKRCIGNAKHPEVTLGFINDILGIDAEEVTIENPYDITLFQDDNNVGKISQTEVDVRVRLSDNSQALIEIQVAKQGFFRERALHYAASRYIGDYERNDLKRTGGFESKYSSLYPLYSINVLNYIQFPDDNDVLRSYSLYDKKHNDSFGGFNKKASKLGLFSLTFLELSKSISTPRQSNIDHWIDFFKGNTLETNAPHHIKKALELSNEQNLSAKEAEMANKINIAEEDRKAQLMYAHDEGREQGLEQGLRKAALQAFAKGLSLDDVQEITGLDRDVLESLQANTNNQEK